MSKIIAIDFDGTIVEHRFPEIGKTVPGAFEWMHDFQRAGARLILFTMRSDRIDREQESCEGHAADRKYLSEAIAFCQDRGINFWGINRNPEQSGWTDSPKPYAHLYIDDAAFGVPLCSPDGPGRAFVDWRIVGPKVMKTL